MGGRELRWDRYQHDILMNSLAQMTSSESYFCHQGLEKKTLHASGCNMPLSSFAAFYEHGGQINCHVC